MHNFAISKIRIHLLQLLTAEDRFTNPKKSKKKGVSESRIRSLDIKSSSLCLETATTTNNLLKML